MGKAFAITAAIFAVIIGVMIYRTGIYKDVTITPGQQGPYILVYKEHFGEYHKIVPTIESVEILMRESGLPCPLAFGRYLDDPDEVEHDRLRSHGGCAFSAMTEQLNTIIKANGLFSESIEKREYVIASFNGSPSMGPIVVYPKIEDWFKKYGYKQSGPVIELYQTLEDKSVLTRYLFAYDL